MQHRYKTKSVNSTEGALGYLILHPLKIASNVHFFLANLNIFNVFLKFLVLNFTSDNIRFTIIFLEVI